MKARFIGNPAKGGEGPELITVFGVTFVKGEWETVEVAVYDRLSTNSHFEVDDPLDHDGDGQKGGSVPTPKPAKKGRGGSPEPAEPEALAETAEAPASDGED